MLYLWLKAFHIMAFVAWFAGLFYLPRLFIYHCEINDEQSNQRFKVMERRLYYGITYPAAIVTTILGACLITLNWQYYLTAGWMHVKLTAIVILWIYHIYCGRYLRAFRDDKNEKSQLFFRFFNEAATIILVVIVIMAVVKPL